MIDTARAYGRSEQVVGAGLRSWSGTKPFVATKIQPRGPQSQFATPPAVDEAFPKGWVTESCETSLRELGLDHVDLMQLHLYWPTWGHDGYWMDELQALKAAAKPARWASRSPTTATTWSSRWWRAGTLRTSHRFEINLSNAASWPIAAADAMAGTMA